MRPSSMTPTVTYIYRRTLWFLGAPHQAQNPLLYGAGLLFPQTWKVHFPKDRGNKKSPAEGRRVWHFQAREQRKNDPDNYRGS
ncbi:MAG: hypothetical protein ABJJ25_17360 [Eudoraea sp.]|uniref:hypothetical protein n=1 Tax=Eudoraea sp. TaxID=1979955 RepID=UPI003267BB56